MADDPVFRQLIEASWRRKLTEGEEAQLRAWLAAHPEAQGEWLLERSLNEALDTLPPAEVPSNFTARVLRAAELESKATPPSQPRPLRLWFWPGWLPKAGFAALVLGVGVFSYHKVMAARRAEMAWSVATVSGVSSLPSAEILKDFNVIWVLDQSPSADEELLALFKNLDIDADSPVEKFREVFIKSTAGRNEILADTQPELRKRVLAKVREYESLSPSQRELRLRVTELRWYLWPLLKTPASNRAALLAKVPADNRKLIYERLRHWDKLPASVQSELLENEATLRYFTELESSTEQQRTNLLKTLSPERRKKLEAGIRQIQAMPEQQRQKLMARFNQFFELSDPEKTKALATLSEPERRLIERTLRNFRRLPPELRDDCIRSFERFVSMDLPERQQFLKNAERWRLMSPEERQDWRAVVASLSVQPPMPPGFGGPPIPPEPEP